MKTKIPLTVSFLLILSTLFSCASRQPVLAIDQVDKPFILAIKVNNFEFVPNHIKVRNPGEILLRLENTAGRGHNFTIKGRGGQIIRSVPLPPNESVAINLRLSDPGVYAFYCDKPFHSTLGMKGTIEILPEDKGMSGGVNRL